MVTLLQRSIRIVFELYVAELRASDEQLGDLEDPITLTFHLNHWEHATAKNPQVFRRPRLTFDEMMALLVCFCIMRFCKIRLFSSTDLFVLECKCFVACRVLFTCRALQPKIRLHWSLLNMPEKVRA
jgi:hypothetical protein